jgi:hypothetical protein
MHRKKYPLESLAHLKKDRAERATRALGKAVAARETLEGARKELERAREEARVATDLVRSKEQERLEEGSLTAGDLRREAAWQSRVNLEDRARAKGVDDARATEERARGAEASARKAVADARAEHETVLRHQQRFRLAAEKREEARDEEERTEMVRQKKKS